MPIYILLLLSRSSPNYASVNTSRGPLCGVWPTQARRVFEGVYLAGRPMRRGGQRGREREEEGDLDLDCKQQGPGMNILRLNTMQVSKYESAKDLAKSIFCNSIWSPEFLT